MTAQRATQAAGAATKPGVAPMATPAAVSGATDQRPAVPRSEEDQAGARRPVDAISLALAAAMNEITARRHAERASAGPARDRDAVRRMGSPESSRQR